MNASNTKRLASKIDRLSALVDLLSDRLVDAQPPLTVNYKQAANLTGVTVDAIRSAVHRNELVTVKRGRSRLVVFGSLKRWAGCDG